MSFNENQNKALSKILEDNKIEDPMLARWANGTIEAQWEAHKRFLTLLNKSFPMEIKVQLFPAILEALLFAKFYCFNLEIFPLAGFLADLYNFGRSDLAEELKKVLSDYLCKYLLDNLDE